MRLFFHVEIILLEGNLGIRQEIQWEKDLGGRLIWVRIPPLTRAGL